MDVNMKLIGLITGAVLSGFVLAALLPGVTSWTGELVRGAVPAKSKSAGGHGHGGHDHAAGEADEHGEEGMLHLTEAQIAAAGIEVAAAAGGDFVRQLKVPGSVALNGERTAIVTARIAGTLAEYRKPLGDQVAPGEVIAVIESREIADSKSEYLAALRAEELARTVFTREEALWRKKISAEQDYLQAKAASQDARIRLDLGRQKLAALGLTASDIAKLPTVPVSSLRFQEVRAPLAGRIVERRTALGAFVTAETELLQIADLSTVWLDLAVPPSDASQFAEGGTVTVEGASSQGEARIFFRNAVVNAETKSLRVLALLPNPKGDWRPGEFITAAAVSAQRKVAIAVPREAVQTLKAEAVVFVRNAEGFEAREVVLGESNDRLIEIKFGLDAGEQVAVKNSFILKAELGKAQAEHSH